MRELKPEDLKWRPIHEIHEDYGVCVAWDGDEFHAVHVCNLDFDEMDYICFTRLPWLKEAEVEEFQRIKVERAAVEAAELAVLGPEDRI